MKLDPIPLVLAWCFRLAVALGLSSAWVASTEPLTLDRDHPVIWGTVTDGLTGAPIPQVILRSGDHFALSSTDGSYELAIDVGSGVLEVFAPLPDGRLETLRQRIDTRSPMPLYRPIVLITEAFLDTHPSLDDAVGLPWTLPRPPLPPSRPIDLIELWEARLARGTFPPAGLLRAELPAVLPESIRVGRRFASTCADNPIQRIDTVDLETYAAGVVTAEIGVFRYLTAGDDSAHECFKTFAIAALSYALWFWARDPDAEYHLDDTACNQRYIDGPYPELIVQAVQETAGAFLVQEGTQATIDKFEYASSCGRHGTLPEYGTDIIEDDIPDIVACTTGGWCGHENCAGHQDNPDLPGTDRCLVRGICQWGSAERSIRGDSYLAILDHYQPFLEVRWPNEPPLASLVGFVRSGSVETGPDISGAQVELDTGEITQTDLAGLYAFDEVESGQRTLFVSASGYEPVEVAVEVLPGVENWASVALEPIGEPFDAEPAEPRPDEDPGDAGLDEGPLPDLVADTDTTVDEGEEQPGDTGIDPAPNPAGSFNRFATVGPGGSPDPGCAVLPHRQRPMTVLVLPLLAAGWFDARRRARRRRKASG